MRHETIPLDQTGSFSSFFLDYLHQKETLRPFYSHFPTIENATQVIEGKKISDEARRVLVEVLKSQYEGVDTHETLRKNIDSLSDQKTFTITTGHQLNIFTGPLYFVYKLVTVINACKQLKKTHPNYQFVPVYWMASEDHDFDEISHFFYDGKKYEWHSDQQGAVGRMDPKGLLEICEILPSGAAFFAEAYRQPTLAAAVRQYVNHLFGEEGLIALDADDPRLKKTLTPVIEDDLFVHSAEDLVAKTSATLHQQRYKTQVLARQVNFFYLEGNIRERIERTDAGFRVLDTDLTFTEEEMRNMILEHPERFSPNVVLRPLYQEMTLPNLAYVGGPSEAVYWLQLKAVFDHFDVPFPMIMPRNFATVMSKTITKKCEKAALTTGDLFEDTEKLISRWVKSQSRKSLSYTDELKSIEKIESSLKQKAEAVDPTLVQHIEAIGARFSKRVAQAEKKLVRAEKRKHEDKRRQIEAIKGALFPNGSLQERHDNLLSFYLNDPSCIQSFLDTFDAFDYRMYLLWE